VTDDKGEYKIVDLRPGTYSVTFALTGFSTVKREGLELTTGFTAAANAEMKVGGLEETVIVTGASPVVDVQNVRTQNVLVREAIDALPTNRTNQALATVTLGASMANLGGTATQDVGGNRAETSVQISIHGNRAGDSKQKIDGLSFNFASGGSGGNLRIYMVNQSAMQEVALETGGMNAEGETGGIQINFVPKEGGTHSGPTSLAPIPTAVCRETTLRTRCAPVASRRLPPSR
jgi:hypothetical protein